jgi:hypothetical protein
MIFPCRIGDLAAVAMKSCISWDVAACSPVKKTNVSEEKFSSAFNKSYKKPA